MLVEEAVEGLEDVVDRSKELEDKVEIERGEGKCRPPEETKERKKVNNER